MIDLGREWKEELLYFCTEYLKTYTGSCFLAEGDMDSLKDTSQQDQTSKPAQGDLTYGTGSQERDCPRERKWLEGGTRSCFWTSVVLPM